MNFLNLIIALFLEIQIVYPNKKRLFSIQEPSRISSVDRGACIKGLSQVDMGGTVCVNGLEYHRRGKC